MKYLPCAVVPLVFILGGCAASADFPESVASSSAPLGQATWHVEKATGSGVGCHFQAPNAPPDPDVNAFVIAAGDDVSIIFTALGNSVRHGKKGIVDVSDCTFSIPVTVPKGFALTSWTQTLSYGIVKPAGAAASLGLQSAFSGNHGMNLKLPDLDKTFDVNADLDIAFDTLSGGAETFDESHGRFPNWRKRWCKRDPDQVDLKLNATAATKVTRADDTQEVIIIAVDSLDMRVDLSPKFEACAP